MASATFLLFGAASVFACMCPGGVGGPVADQVRGTLQTSSAVFTGKVIGFEYQKGILYKWEGFTPPLPDDSQDRETKLIRFEVDRWWKMPLPNEILIITDQTRLANPPAEILPPGNIVLLPKSETVFSCAGTFMKGESYLVYSTGTADQLQYRICSRTTSLNKAADDLNVLGKGNKPRKSIN